MKRLTIISIFSTLLVMACSHEADAPDAATAAVCFGVETRASGGGATLPDLTRQQVRLYLGVYQTEHEQGGGSGDGYEDDTLHLHNYLGSEPRYNHYSLQRGNAFDVNFVLPQRYKFCFVCTPRIDGIFKQEDGKRGCDLNAVYIDYSPILDGQKTDANMVQTGHLFRKIINRWLKSGETLAEDVVMTRVNGQLLVDMGVLEDQFEHRVEKIEAVIKGSPIGIYLTDSDRDSIKAILPEPGTELLYTFEPDPALHWNIPNEADRIHYTFALNLLPGELSGKLQVYCVDENGTPVEKQYPLAYDFVSGYATDEDKKVVIKQNTRTTLEFNGLHRDYFAVKYAGFDDSQIGVDDDKWDGID